MAIFDPTKEVPRLDLCKRLKELGFPQEGGGYYWDFENHELAWVWAAEVRDSLIKAPTCRELGEWLPMEVVEPNYREVPDNDAISYLPFYSQHGRQWVYWYQNYYDDTLGNFYALADTEADARAQMLIWLAERGYVKFGENTD